MRILWLFLTLLPLPLVFSNSVNNTENLLWGAYRPNLYFGLRPRLPQSLMTGLVWFGTQNYQSIAKARHACDQGDGLDSYTWTHFNPRQGGVQILRDSQNNVEITTEFLKVPGGSHGGSWVARIKGAPINPMFPSRISTIFYLGLEGLGGIDMVTDESENGIDGPVEFSGTTPDLGDFTIRIVDAPDNEAVTTGPHSEAFEERLGKTHLAGLRLQPGQLWTAKDHIMQSIVNRASPIVEKYRTAEQAPDPSFTLQLPDDILTASNLFAVQKFFEGEFHFDVFFESASANQTFDASTIDQGIAAVVASFNSRFEETFPIPPSYPANDVTRLKSFSKAITSNLFGGIGYFYGTSIIDKGFAYEWDQDDEIDAADDGQNGARLTEPRALLTATPSRSFFPRGFYWDEGFHLLHIGAWDTELSLEILKGWIKLIDSDGWVAREQILGEEARSRVPAQFQTQVPTFANPPTLTMAVTAIIKKFNAAHDGPSAADLGMDYGMNVQMPFASELESSAALDRAAVQSVLRDMYKPLKRHYEWFRRTQRGQIKQYGRRARSRTEGYRWRGRSEAHVLTSGMDDYPRGPPHAGELHLDLISWMGFFTRTMKDFAQFIDEEEDAASFAEIESAIINNIDDLHWDEESEMYCDVGIDSDDESTHICHAGYVSLFPFMLSLLPPDSSHLGPILDMLHDPEQLWSEYGIRSLSKSHPEFGKGENYWKGPIWVQINYMVLGALHNTYAREEGPFQEKAREIYEELRRNLVNNVFEEYQRTGYVWEQYDPLTGEGQRSHPFTGWTSLVTLILAEIY